MKNIYYIISFIVIMWIAACTPHTHVHNDEEEDAHAHEEVDSDEEVHLLQKQMDVMGIEMGGFQLLNLSSTVKANGQLELPPQNKASLSAVVGGRVNRINVQSGDYVKKGQTLAGLEHPDFVEVQQNYMTATSDFSFLEQDYLRKKKLYSDSISSAKAFQQSEAKYLSALARMNGLKAKLRIMSIDPASVEKGNFSTTIPVRSPINGFVRHIDINMGKFVQPQEEMFEIVDNEHIHIDLMVYEKDLNKVMNGQKVIFSLSNDPDSVFQGSIFAVGKSFEKEPKAMVVHAEIDNKQGNLLSGMYVDARIITNDENVRALPDEAIVSDGGLQYVFVLSSSLTHAEQHAKGEPHDHNIEDGHEGEYVFRKIEVNTGATDIGFTEVVPVYDLPDEVKVVTKGAFYLLAEMKKGEGGHGHHH